MFTFTRAFSSFSTPDIAVTKQFYSETLGLNVKETPEGLELQLGDNQSVFIYPAPHPAPAFTILNFVVEDIDTAVNDLMKRGVTMEQYDTPQIKTDAKGICRNDGSQPGPKAIGWCKDPAGHIIAVIQEK